MDARIAHRHNTRHSNTDTARSCVDAEAEPLRAQETSQTCRAVANSPHADRIDRQAAGYTTAEQKRPAGGEKKAGGGAGGGGGRSKIPEGGAEPHPPFAA